VQVSGVPAQFEPAEAETTAEFVKVPNSPKIKPEIAVAAINVTAIMITVARTAEIPFFRGSRMDRISEFH
jgi:hypothetical protein